MVEATCVFRIDASLIKSYNSDQYECDLEPKVREIA